MELIKDIDKLDKTRHDYFYFQIATNYLITYKKALDDFLEKEGYHENLKAFEAELTSQNIQEISKDDLKKLQEKYEIKNYTGDFFYLHSTAYIIVVFSALCLESLINDYCVIKKSSTYFKKYIDKLDPLSKWVIIPKLILNKEISTDSIAHQLLQDLFKLRNDMVHPKAKETDKPSVTKETTQLILRKVPASYRAITEATHELYKLDPDFSYLKDYKWLWDKSEKFSNVFDIQNFYSTHFG